MVRAYACNCKELLDFYYFLYYFWLIFMAWKYQFISQNHLGSRWRESRQIIRHILQILI